MRKWIRLLALFGAFGLIAVTAACGSDEESSAFKQCKEGETDGDLNFYNWSEYMDPDLIAAFQDQYGVTVTEDFYPSNEEMHGKIGVGNSGYDMIVPSDYMVSILITDGLIQPVQTAAVPNQGNIAERFGNPPYDPGAVYTAAYQWGTTGIGVDLGVTGEDVPRTWGLLFDADLAEQYGLAGKISLLDDPRETVGAALKYLGHSLNSTSADELAAAEAVIEAGGHRRPAAGLGFDDREDRVAGELGVLETFEGEAHRGVARRARGALESGESGLVNGVAREVDGADEGEVQLAFGQRAGGLFEGPLAGGLAGRQGQACAAEVELVVQAIGGDVGHGADHRGRAQPRHAGGGERETRMTSHARRMPP